MLLFPYNVTLFAGTDLHRYHNLMLHVHLLSAYVPFVLDIVAFVACINLLCVCMCVCVCVCVCVLCVCVCCVCVCVCVHEYLP